MQFRQMNVNSINNQEMDQEECKNVEEGEMEEDLSWFAVNMHLVHLFVFKKVTVRL